MRDIRIPLNILKISSEYNKEIEITIMPIEHGATSRKPDPNPYDQLS